MMLFRRIAISAAAFALALAGASAGAQKPSGTAGAAASGEALPADFRGRIVYSGTHEGRVNTPGPPPRRLDLRSIARAAGRTREYAGAYELVLDFNGNALSARVSGTGGLLATTLSGTRRGDRCRLIDDRHGTITEAQCTATRFVGTARTQAGSRQNMTREIEAGAVQFVDSAREERERAALAASEASRTQACWDGSVIPAPAQCPPRQAGGTPARAADDRLVITTAALGVSLDTLLDRIVYADSRTWQFNQYVRGSMRNARYETANRARTTYVAHGTYAFRRGGGPEEQGWVRVWIRDGEFGCISFHDDPPCRPMNAGLSQRAFGAMTSALGTAILQESGMTGVCADTRFVDGLPVMTPRAC